MPSALRRLPAKQNDLIDRASARTSSCMVALLFGRPLIDLEDAQWHFRDGYSPLMGRMLYKFSWAGYFGPTAAPIALGENPKDNPDFRRVDLGNAPIGLMIYSFTCAITGVVFVPWRAASNR